MTLDCMAVPVSSLFTSRAAINLVPGLPFTHYLGTPIFKQAPLISMLDQSAFVSPFDGPSFRPDCRRVTVSTPSESRLDDLLTIYARIHRKCLAIASGVPTPSISPDAAPAVEACSSDVWMLSMLAVMSSIKLLTCLALTWKGETLVRRRLIHTEMDAPPQLPARNSTRIVPEHRRTAAPLLARRCMTSLSGAISVNIRARVCRRAVRAIVHLVREMETTGA